ncbi:hypothetical protein pv_152 [Pithovirus sibericum]|uniref:F-box domain-containing protein n=1 Tax=Pithovirus sibericum TaxID=1450746 RepID=W5S4Y6_9VIRU|nr:hypothetical protein pv_152 [Pithovirus sibericum]AHH01719.1 hypothetical protein pv_152 [Pithovirus sibericum]
MTLPNELVEKILLNLPYQDIISFPKLNFSFGETKPRKISAFRGGTLTFIVTVKIPSSTEKFPVENDISKFGK